MYCTDTALNKLTFVQHTGGQPLKCRNYQEIKLQEQVQRLAMGTIPRSLWVVLEDDLVDVCKAGDDVIIWFVDCFSDLIVSVTVETFKFTSKGSDENRLFCQNLLNQYQLHNNSEILLNTEQNSVSIFVYYFL